MRVFLPLQAEAMACIKGGTDSIVVPADRWGQIALFSGAGGYYGWVGGGGVAADIFDERSG